LDPDSQRISRPQGVLCRLILAQKDQRQRTGAVLGLSQQFRRQLRRRDAVLEWVGKRGAAGQAGSEQNDEPHQVPGTRTMCFARLALDRASICRVLFLLVVAHRSYSLWKSPMACRSAGPLSD